MMAFLCGGTEYAPEGGRAWRSRLRAWLEENLNHHVYDSTLEARRGLRRAGRRGIGLKPPSCHAEPVGHSAANGPEHSEGLMVNFAKHRCITLKINSGVL